MSRLIIGGIALSLICCASPQPKVIYKTLPIKIEAGPPRLTFPGYGFSIQSLDHSLGTDQVTPLMIFAAPTDGFAPNISVMIQNFHESYDDYLALSRNQLTAAGHALISEPYYDKTGLYLEYTGRMNDRQLRWYQKAIKVENHVYLITATALFTQWATHGGLLKHTVESFRLENAQKKN